MPGRRHHRVVDRDRGEGAEQETLRPQRVHLADFLVERAACQGHPERAFLVGAGLAVFQALAAGILALAVAPDAVVHLVQRLLLGHSGIGQGEPVARPPVMLGQSQHPHAITLDGLDRHQMLRVHAMRHAEQGPATMRRAPCLGQRRPRRIAQRQVERTRVLRLLPACDMGGECRLAQRLGHADFECQAQRRAIER